MAGTPAYNLSGSQSFRTGGSAANDSPGSNWHPPYYVSSPLSNHHLRPGSIYSVMSPHTAPNFVVTTHVYSRSARMTADNVDFNLWLVDLWGDSTSGNAARVILEIIGQTANVPVFIRRQRLMLWAINSTAHTVSTIGTGIAGRTGVLAVTLDVTTDLTKLVAKVKIQSGGSATATGLRASLKMEGGVQTVFQYASWILGSASPHGMPAHPWGDGCCGVSGPLD